ncbi:hypothetical protein B0H15DRAFT_947360 [Mycena belliarum]|uniref:Uncharacterized protein n=1 Tax=Mycena belliarum TaxID=1033014 RepID=A0AAD6UB35_9AGAR|nr:hypothetical protein B0H15DRAFT_947360 [Mycena belliae]
MPLGSPSLALAVPLDNRLRAPTRHMCGRETRRKWARAPGGMFGAMIQTYSRVERAAFGAVLAFSVHGRPVPPLDRAAMPHTERLPQHVIAMCWGAGTPLRSIKRGRDSEFADATHRPAAAARPTVRPRACDAATLDKRGPIRACVPLAANRSVCSSVSADGNLQRSGSQGGQLTLALPPDSTRLCTRAVRLSDTSAVVACREASDGPSVAKDNVLQAIESCRFRARISLHRISARPRACDATALDKNRENSTLAAAAARTAARSSVLPPALALATGLHAPCLCTLAGKCEAATMKPSHSSFIVARGLIDDLALKSPLNWGVREWSGVFALLTSAECIYPVASTQRIPPSPLLPTTRSEFFERRILAPRTTLLVDQYEARAA